MKFDLFMKTLRSTQDVFRNRSSLSTDEHSRTVYRHRLTMARLVEQRYVERKATIDLKDLNAFVAFTTQSRVEDFLTPEEQEALHAQTRALNAFRSEHGRKPANFWPSAVHLTTQVLEVEAMNKHYTTLGIALLEARGRTLRAINGYKMSLRSRKIDDAHWPALVKAGNVPPLVVERRERLVHRIETYERVLNLQLSASEQIKLARAIGRPTPIEVGALHGEWWLYLPEKQRLVFTQTEREIAAFEALTETGPMVGVLEKRRAVNAAYARRKREEDKVQLKMAMVVGRKEAALEAARVQARVEEELARGRSIEQLTQATPPEPGLSSGELNTSHGAAPRSTPMPSDLRNIVEGWLADEDTKETEDGEA